MKGALSFILSALIGAFRKASMAFFWCAKEMKKSVVNKVVIKSRFYISHYSNNVYYWLEKNLFEFVFLNNFLICLSNDQSVILHLKILIRNYRVMHNEFPLKLPANKRNLGTEGTRSINMIPWDCIKVEWYSSLMSPAAGYKLKIIYKLFYWCLRNFHLICDELHSLKFIS